MKYLFIVVAALALVACDEISPDQRQRYQPTALTIQSSTRFSVERIDVFRDKLAYDGQRGIYVITDTKTGKEFIGVSGIGISELGSHLAGKVTSTDER
jgi:secreted trypsin-like serine protease